MGLTKPKPPLPHYDCSTLRLSDSSYISLPPLPPVSNTAISVSPQTVLSTGLCKPMLKYSFSSCASRPPPCGTCKNQELEQVRRKNARMIIVNVFPQYAGQYETSRSSSRDRAGPEFSQSSSNYEGYSGSRDGAVPGGVPFPGTGGKVREGRGRALFY